MRPTVLILPALLSTLLLVPAARADDSACKDCHAKGGDPDAPVVDFDQFKASLHAQSSVSCTDCHAGYATGPHAGELKPLADDDAKKLARLNKADWGDKKKVRAARALLACSNCHDKEAAAYAGSVHGKWLAADAKVAGPTCVSCHGSPHAIMAPLAPYAPKDGKRVAVPDDRRAIAKRCEACHGNEEFAKAAGLSTEVASTYHDSIHGRNARVGNAFAPVCVSCHAADPAQGGTHAIFAKDDPRSQVSKEHRKEACARCHAGANDNFASLIAHKPIQETGGSIVPHIIHVAFSWLTTLTLLVFAFHVAIDFVYELRQRLSRKGHAGDAVAAARSVVRFDLHQRAQHWLMLSGVILLGITGWPLRGAGDAEAARYSAQFLRLFGGAEGAAIWHRVGAVLIITSSVYHLFYLTFLAAKKRLPMSMLPMPKDALDMRDNILFMLGLRKERPKFERFMYLEKFDYWAVFWGIVMMVGTGFIFWFPAWFASWAPSWLITAALIIHGEEATLAILFLFVVHFYNVHLKPSIFPMNWAWLNGRISVDMLKHEHALEYERLKPKLDE